MIKIVARVQKEVVYKEQWWLCVVTAVLSALAEIEMFLSSESPKLSAARMKGMMKKLYIQCNVEPCTKVDTVTHDKARLTSH